MKKWFMLMLFMLAGTPVHAQTGGHRFEFAFSPYSFAQLDAFNLHGAGAALAVNVSGPVSIVADFSLHKTAGDNARISGIPGFGVATDEEHFAFRFGPRFTSRRGKASIFGQILIGGMHLRHSSEVRVSGITVKDTTTEHGWAGLAGGGIDYHVNDWFAFRLIEANYAPIYLDGFVIHGPRISAGLIFHLQ